ncbi:MAG: GatB/YqeY domain-containing protein [Brevefilum sp.]|nr:GatB/YqeY domain-containing protein [Brevefilum sp.]MDW7753615.1 GatB/YqeY domain-containing protein [Brevefilum sp.]
MKLKNEIQTALTAAMKARNEDTKRTLRLVMSSIKLSEVEDRGELDDSRILSILQKEVKTREDSIQEARQAGREDLVKAAEREIEILNQFLPKQMAADELKVLAKQVIEETGATSIKDMGTIMKNLMPKLEGRASGQDASKTVRELLQNN